MFYGLLAQEGGWFTTGTDLLPHLKIPLYITAALALVAAIVLFIVYRRKRKKGEVRDLRPRVLRNIWRAFLGQIPREFRRSVLFFQPFVVFGESGAGKSLLISRYTDWKGQAAQFYPSYSVDPMLQIYLGSRALVQELPPTLLADITPKARVALQKLWQPLFRKREPIVVVALSAAALKNATPESLRTQAQTLRGKINILSRITNKPVAVRMVLTHMDQVEGYLAFSQFVEKQEIPHQIKLDPKSAHGGLETCLEPFEQYLPLALASLPAKAYLKVLTFLNKAPETFVNLGILLKTLKESDPLSFEPDVSELFLTSDTSGSPSAISNPFAASFLDQSLAIQKASQRRHKWITSAILLAGLAYLGVGFLFARTHLDRAKQAIEKFEKLHDPQLAPVTAEEISNFAHGTDWPIAHAVLPTYFSTAPADMRARFVKAIRDLYLLPMIKDASVSANAHERTLFLLALLYASQGNELGRFIEQGHIAEWSQALKIPELLIEAYIRESAEPWDEPFQLGALPYERRASPLSRPEPWHSFLIDVQVLMDRHWLTPERLAALQDVAGQLQDGLQSMQRQHTAQTVYELLRGNPHFPRKEFQAYIDDLQAPAWLLTQAEPLSVVLQLVIKSDLRSTVLQKKTLDNLVTAIKGIKSEALPNGSVVRVTLEDKDYTVDTRKWLELINNGKIRLAIQDFIRTNQTAGSRIFFVQGDVAPSEDATMTVRSGSDFLFARPYIVPRRYTKDRYEREVKLQLLQFESVAHDTGLDKDRELFQGLDALVGDACDQYGTEYEAHWRKYYDSWSIDAHSLAALKVVLAQMRLPVSSVFQEFLEEVRANTRFERSESKYLNRIANKLQAFRPVNMLFPDEGAKAPSKDAKDQTVKAELPEFEKYRAILERMALDLEQPGAGTQVSDPKELARTPVEFTDLLTPVARLSYSILHEQRDSYMKITEDWLKAQGIVDTWRNPFLEPVRQMHALGLQDLQTVVAKNWDRRVLSQVVPLLQKFPFLREAIVDATPHDVEEDLHPTTGYFWVAWKNLIAPICAFQNGEWKPMKGLEPDKGFTWPAGIFETTNRLSKLTQTLWNEKAQPKALVLQIQPQGLPAPSGKPGKPEIVLSFLQSGKSSVFGFNQKPTWQTLNIEWWTRPGAQVGLQVGDPETNAKSYRSITEPESAWSFYHLLQRDRQAERNVWIWNLSQGEPEYPAPVLKFAFKDDPWEIFDVPTFASSQEKKADNEGK